MNLIYRATRDGFSASSFHSRCDGQANTLTVVKSEHGNIFGGFTTKAWTSKNVWISDPEAFIFSFINKEDKPFKVLVSNGGQYAIAGDSKYGPRFGGDIEIKSNSNTDRESFSYFSYHYKHSDYSSGTGRAAKILAGSVIYKTLEIEVFNLAEVG